MTQVSARKGVRVCRWRRVCSQIAGFIGFRVPQKPSAVVALLGNGTKWGLLWVAGALPLHYGRGTSVGAGLLGAVMPLLAFEAAFTGRSRWRIRLCQTLGFAVPTCVLLAFVSAANEWIPVYQPSPWAKMAAFMEFVGDGLLYCALATLPAVALLISIWRRSASPVERRAHNLTTLTVLVATLLIFVLLGGAKQLMELQFDSVPSDYLDGHRVPG